MFLLLCNGTMPLLGMANLADQVALIGEIVGSALPLRLWLANLAAAGNARLGEAARARSSNERIRLFPNGDL